nr:serine/threonine-protein kinase VPS15-like [Tanacetum cinerariifolium]
LTLWDLRFGIPVNSWQYSDACPIADMCLFVPSQSTSLSTTVRPLVYVAAGCNEVSLWNAENGSCHQVLRVANNDNEAETSDQPWALTRPSDGSRALCATMLHGSAQVVVGASDGTIHMFSVDYISRGLGSVVEKYSGIADVKKNNIGEGAILALLNYSSGSDDGKMILYSTQNCGIHLRDTRENSKPWDTKVVPEEGYVSSLVASPCGNWFVSGSSRGVLTLWDLRFGIPVNSWQYSDACPIADMCLFVPSQSTSLSTTVRPLVYVAAGCNEVSLWNAENGSCHQVLRSVPPVNRSPPGNGSNERIPGDRGGDGLVNAQGPTGKAVLAAAATDSGGCHRDSILSLASVKLNQRLLLSSSRDGTVKVWK